VRENIAAHIDSCYAINCEQLNEFAELATQAETPRAWVEQKCRCREVSCEPG
jgi:hypothetical protein